MKIKISPLDRLFSQFIRLRAMKRVGGCERCLTSKNDIQKEDGSILSAWQQLDCAHFHGRGSQSVRHDEDNAIGACGACHMYLDSHPVEKVEFFRQGLGQERFDMLQCRARTPAKYIDKVAIGLYLKLKISELEK